jgi:hypothetical protein
MSVRPRDVKVFVALLVSMMAGTTVLMALSNNPPLAGAFCLSSYYNLEPVEKSIISRASSLSNRWNSIKIYYSDTKGGNIEQLSSISGLIAPEDIGCHFVVCNGLGATDGEIQPTEKWQRQWSAMLARGGDDGGQTIRICVISDGATTLPTDFQIKRVDALVEELCRKFNIQREYIYYPSGW